MFGEHYSYDDQIFDEGMEKMLRNAIESGAPTPLLITMAERSDISLERLQELIEEVNGGVLV